MIKDIFGEFFTILAIMVWAVAFAAIIIGKMVQHATKDNPELRERAKQAAKEQGANIGLKVLEWVFKRK